MGLNDSYSAVRSQILLMQPLPSINQAYSMLVQEEPHRQLSSLLLSASEPTALCSSTTPTGSSKRKFNGTYDHCHVRGHKRETCYKLIVFPLILSSLERNQLLLI